MVDYLLLKNSKKIIVIENNLYNILATIAPTNPIQYIKTKLVITKNIDE